LGDRDEGRTILVFGKPERVSGPNSDKLRAVVPKRMQDHILDAMRLRRAPYHDFKPRTRAWCKEVLAECGQVRAGHHAAWCGAQMRMAAGGARWSRRAQGGGAI